MPTEAPNNFQLGDALEQVIQLNFDARSQQKRPKMPQYLNLKLCFIGYSFAGKKTQATMLQDLYGLQTYQLNDLVDEALTFSEQNPEPFTFDAPAKQEESILDEAVMSQDSEAEDSYHEMSVKEGFRLCGENIASLLKDGQEIPDEVYVELYVAKLRITYPYKSKKQ